MDYSEAYARLKSIGEEQLLRYYGELTDRERAALLSQIAGTDFSCVPRFREKNAPSSAAQIAPIRTMTRGEILADEEALRERGLSLLTGGRTAAVLLAGGMGTRLGMDGPKGSCDIGITRPVYIFQRLVENLLIRVREAGRPIRLFVMTSDTNDAATRQFFADHGYFGYDSAFISFFSQDMAPVVGDDGHVLLESKGRIATSPNGNGGWFRSMERAGLTSLLAEEGVTYLNVFNVDNVLQNVCDPLFLGAVDLAGVDAGAKVVRKRSPEEKTGVMCLRDGRASVIEYYEMTDEMLRAEDEDGHYVYSSGVIGNYLFRLSALTQSAGAELPLHFAHKAVPHVAEDGTALRPDAPNAWKFEYFIFDILSSMKGCLPFEVLRDEEFAPVKNREGADSVETARELCRKNGIAL